MKRVTFFSLIQIGTNLGFAKGVALRMRASKVSLVVVVHGVLAQELVDHSLRQYVGLVVGRVVLGLERVHESRPFAIFTFEDLHYEKVTDLDRRSFAWGYVMCKAPTGDGICGRRRQVRRRWATRR